MSCSVVSKAAHKSHKIRGGRRDKQSRLDRIDKSLKILTKAVSNLGLYITTNLTNQAELSIESNSVKPFYSKKPNFC